MRTLWPCISMVSASITDARPCSLAGTFFLVCGGVAKNCCAGARTLPDSSFVQRAGLGGLPHCLARFLKLAQRPDLWIRQPGPPLQPQPEQRTSCALVSVKDGVGHMKSNEAASRNLIIGF